MSDNSIEELNNQAVIKVIGVGGAGGNAIRNMFKKTIKGISFCVANTDQQALDKIKESFQNLSYTQTTPDIYQSGTFESIQLGNSLTRGLGAGAKPEIGRRAVEESVEDIRSYLEGADMLFITAGMGGGTGTGAAPMVANLAKQMGILTVAVVTKPFPFEGSTRMRNAKEGIHELVQYVDSLIVIPNEKLLSALGRGAKLTECFGAADDVLYKAVQSISEMITNPGEINVDFADVKTTMLDMGTSMMGTGEAEGEDAALIAAEKAVHSPLLESVDIEGARSILINVTGGENMSISDFSDVNTFITEKAAEDANIVIGTSIDPTLTEKDGIKVTLVATGVDNGYSSQVPQRPMGRPQVAQRQMHQERQPRMEQRQRTPAMERQPVNDGMSRRASFNEESSHEEVDYNDGVVGSSRVLRSEEEARQERLNSIRSQDRYPEEPPAYQEEPRGSSQGLSAIPDDAPMGRDIDIPKKKSFLPGILKRGNKG